jgi:hypothetical protein
MAAERYPCSAEPYYRIAERRYLDTALIRNFQLDLP